MYSIEKAQCGPYEFIYSDDSDVHHTYRNYLCNIDDTYWLNYYNCTNYYYNSQTINLDIENFKEKYYDCSYYITQTYSSVDLSSY
ncbi:uncharacterized protein ASCRUDRAFT_76689 [Ascoidea rubescens DSM 1968]|uniref:Uncharacterized protein n=1 Tax=Ascoidea rubescens DSM 1968 TaxID=1344418 RepID=A0A1D2VEU0_9ASCO|nr:hypothetical protein ASCRUDRAFT_76689 [Ascoidea rubescens DSM 1968]ODV60194.1 hypothetical protein ASCRUDRAFT_76689 [Ascoidea rubescens DSM 1968]